MSEIRGDNESLGAFIRRCRKKRGWTLDRLGAKTGVGNSILSLVENDRRNPSPRLARALQEALNLHPEAMMSPAHEPLATAPGGQLLLSWR